MTCWTLAFLALLPSVQFAHEAAKQGPARQDRPAVAGEKQKPDSAVPQ